MEMLKIIFEFVEKAGVFAFYQLNHASSSDAALGYGVIFLAIIFAGVIVAYHAFDFAQKLIYNIFDLIKSGFDSFFGIFGKFQLSGSKSKINNLDSKLLDLSKRNKIFEEKIIEILDKKIDKIINAINSKSLDDL